MIERERNNPHEDVDVVYACISFCVGRGYSELRVCSVCFDAPVWKERITAIIWAIIDRKYIVEGLNVEMSKFDFHSRVFARRQVASTLSCDDRVVASTTTTSTPS